MARHSRQLAGAASGFVISLVLSFAASAQEATANGDQSILLQPVFIGSESAGQNSDAQTATRAETVLTERITRQQLDAAQIFDPDDIGRLDPGVGYSRSSGSFSVRGLQDNRVLTTVDGIPLSWLDDGARGVTGGSATVDFDSLSAIDIVKGSDSSIFGAGALGGIVALRTLNPEDLLAGDKSFGGLSRLTFDSKDQSFGIDQALAARYGDTYMLLQGGFRKGHETDNKGDVGGYGSDRTEPEPLDYDQKNLLVKLRQHVGVDQVFGLTGEIYDRDEDIDDRTASTTTYEPGSAARQEVEKRKRISASYELGAGAGAWLDAADLVVYWQRQELSDDFWATRQSTPVGDYSRLSDIEDTTFGFNGSVMKHLDLGGLTHKISVGSQISGNRTSQLSSGEDNCPEGPYSYAYFFTCNFLHTNQADMPEVHGMNVGLFVEDQISVTDRFRLTPGLRFDYYEQNPQETDAFLDNATYDGLPDASSDSAFSPKLRAEFDVTSNALIYAQWAQGFRAPTATELYLSYGGPGTYLSLGNPDLEAETSNGFELGIKASHRSFDWQVSAFYNRYKNFIDTQSVDAADVGIPAGTYPFGITSYFNRESVEIYGIDAAAKWQMTETWHSALSLAGYVGRDRETGEHLNSIPAAKAIANLGYGNGIWGADAILTVAAARTEAENDISKTPSYTLLDLTAWWKPEQLEGVKVQAGLYNVFDETYYDALDIPDSATQAKQFYTEAGRSFRATLTYQF
ncbi:TonB-dependent hemoglobin/transferrin/lactoferrin family receptor [Jiella mangrovi]|uniref:TonB-dependent hemoglobin/transferrin/lactoferrin family receptor n=1 Tax=Jiella mangrovi TaxID=2821407 RepID=A0ABS4BHL4_9HYPH|nr:TonB-dependent hemoglobin/transferrin/lactoferrin family receptor [Jiella mangrovi]MBP0616242.1 TonB-dependent hemoglobin/transferrin/lactoferrin family receptor [Jiella mangrovi]